MTRFRVMLLRPYIVLAFAVVIPAGAKEINFEAQSMNRGGNLTGIPDSPLTIGEATFTGGELLSGEVGLDADSTGVYASEGLFGSGETNPLVITFVAPVRDFSILVLNVEATRSYTAADNLGDSVTETASSTGSSGTATFSLTGSAIRQVTITSGNVNTWDFAVDNVSFTDTAAASTPEPQSLFLLGTAFLLLTAMLRKQHLALPGKRIFGATR